MNDTGTTVVELLGRLSPELRSQALTHPAWAGQASESYERLEFLGDAVLGLAIARELCDRFPELAEGPLSKLKAAVVSREACAEVAREQGLEALLVEHAPDSADATHVRAVAGRASVLAAAIEAVIGAAFSGLGYSAAERAIVALFADRIQHAQDHPADWKSALQEAAQKNGSTVEYRLQEATGPDHERVFTMRAELAKEGLSAVGEGRTKKAAEQEAARRLLDQYAPKDAL